ncbi:hypothetical protein BD289DRAFT_434578 [Coniella lustricola]|uniref:Uncharacterized protein n=1 Tax=Coniella lustricola TaxID=2025994 RepID=A0A2T3A795_9PEZI|nr:hypothetical protein BD289DRAFT_434578 [Coniella lustricola]
MSSVIFSSEEARFLRLVLRLVDRPVTDLDLQDDAHQSSTLLESLIAAGLQNPRPARGRARRRPRSAMDEDDDATVRVLVIGDNKGGGQGALRMVREHRSEIYRTVPIVEFFGIQTFDQHMNRLISTLTNMSSSFPQISSPPRPSLAWSLHIRRQTRSAPSTAAARP